MFGRKIKPQRTVVLSENQFCQVWEHDVHECVRNIYVNANADYYTLLYRDGKFLGTPQRNGGKMYPFSYDPLVKGSRSKNKEITSAKVVFLSSAYSFKVLWGTPHRYQMFDKNKKPYRVGASGTLFMNITPDDNGRHANTFYRTMLSHGDASKMTTAKLSQALREQYENVIGSKLEKVLANLDRSFEELVALTPSEKLMVSSLVFDELQSIFGEHGLTLEEGSRNSAVFNMVISSNDDFEEHEARECGVSTSTQAMF